MKRLCFGCGDQPPVDGKVLLAIIALLGLLILILSLCDCGTVQSVDQIPRTKTTFLHPTKHYVLEKVRVFRHYWDCSDEEFRKHVEYMIDGTGYEDIRVVYWNGTTFRRGHIIAIVIYYKKNGGS